MPTRVAGGRSIAPCEGERGLYGESGGRRECIRRVHLRLRLPASAAALFSGQPSSLTILKDVYHHSPVPQPGIGDL